METNTPTRDLPINLYRPNAPWRSRLLANERLTPEGHPSDVRHLVFDLEGGSMRYLEGQSVGILPPGTDEAGKPHKLRLYSVASARRGDRGDHQTVSLCVKRVVYTDPETGREVRGVASNYLCDLQPGAEVDMTGPVGRTFLLPEDPTASLLMVATGTGIAPFRAFLAEVFRPDHPFRGHASLFFGTPTSAEILYRSEFEAHQDRPDFHLTYAISREQQDAEGRRMYVQHRLREQAERIAELVARPNTVVYMCGLKGMETGVEEAIAEVATRRGHDWAALRESYKQTKRWHVETY
jgi:ferredoxin--NADP+ reductase